MNNQEITQYVEGDGCECNARCEGECGCGADWTPKEVYVLQKRIVELEKERDVYASAFHQLKGEFVRCDNCGDQSECKDFDIFNGGTVDWLQADRDLNQQADGIESLITSSDTIDRSSMNNFYRREAIKLRNKASALKEPKQ
jgi:hypothetical protein